MCRNAARAEISALNLVSSGRLFLTQTNNAYEMHVSYNNCNRYNSLLALWEGQISTSSAFPMMVQANEQPQIIVPSALLDGMAQQIFQVRIWIKTKLIWIQMWVMYLQIWRRRRPL
jgi:hypothetical protein